MMSQLTDVQGVGVRQNLTFFRTQKNQGQVVVGKFCVILKVVNDYMAAEEPMFDGANLTIPRKSPSQVHPLPVEQPYFKWRVRVDLRQIINLPMSGPETAPSTFVELGWSLYDNSEPADSNKVMSVLIENNQFPDFNQQLLLHNPKEVSDVSGFFWLTIKDKNRQDDPKIAVIKLALDNLKPFHPVAISARLPGGPEEDSAQEFAFKFSLVLEKPIQSQVDQLCYVTIKGAHFQPLPSNVKRFALALTTNSADFELPARTLDMSDQEQQLREILAEHRGADRTTFISQWMRTTPDPVENMFGALTYFVVPKSFLT